MRFHGWSTGPVGVYLDAESQKTGILGILDTEEHFPNHLNWGTFWQNHVRFCLIYQKILWIIINLSKMHYWDHYFFKLSEFDIKFYLKIDNSMYKTSEYLRNIWNVHFMKLGTFWAFCDTETWLTGHINWKPQLFYT